MTSHENSIVYEIRWASVALGKAKYSRPCIVFADVPATKSAWLLPLSTKEYSQLWLAFRIDPAHSDFAATGLDGLSFTVDPPAEVPLAEIGEKVGVLTGKLAIEFKEWMDL